MMSRYVKILLWLFIPTIIVMGALVWERIPKAIFGIFMFALLVYGLMWDIWATKHGWFDRSWLWKFNSKTMSKTKLFGHPIGETLFIVLVFTWEILLWELVHQALETSSTIDVMGLIFVGLWTLIATGVIYRFQTR